MDAVRKLLKSLDLEQYAAAFESNDIDEQLLAELTAEDLKDLGVASLGHRKRILAAIAAGAQAAPEPEAAAPPEDAAGAERREVTTIFADLTGYTRLSRELETEDMHALLSSFFTRFDEIVRRTGGTVDRHIGDCVMAVFGAPVSYGNDAERALRASAEMHLAMEEIALQFGRPLSVHIGVAAGNVLFKSEGLASQRDRGFMLTGDSVNLASRLADMAQGGETLITESIHNALGDRILCDKADTTSVKGVDEPVAVRRFLGFRQSPEARPIVGRAVELAALSRALDMCRDDGRGEVVALVGEAGLGKSRTAEEAQREAAARGFVCAKALILDFGAGEANEPVRALLAALCGLGERAEPSATAAAVKGLLADGVIDDQAAPFLTVALGAPLEGPARLIHDAMTDAARAEGRRRGVGMLLRGRAAVRPLLLVVEDLHWADAETLASLSELAAETAAAPILLLVTTRPEGDPLGPSWRRSIGSAAFRRIELAPLSAADALQLARGTHHPTEDVLRDCIARAEGNPLFLDQLLRHAREHGATAVPGSIQSIIQARLDRLSLTDRRALQAAAIIGQRFAMTEVAAVARLDLYDERPLVAAGLIHPFQQRYLFAHALIRDAVLQTILRADLREMHRRAAAWFRDRDTLLHAEHLAAAQEPGAAAAFLRAGTEARAAHRKEAALTLARRGLEHADDAPTRAALLRLEGHMLRDLGRSEEAIAAFEAAHEASTTAVDRCRAQLGVVAALRILDRIDEAYVLLDQAEAAAAADALDAELSEIHYFRGSLHFPRGNLEGCLKEHGLSLRHAESCGDPERRALALSGLGDAYYAQGRMFTAHGAIEQCLSLADAHGLGAVEAANRFMLATVKIYMNDTERALSEALASAQLACQVGHARAEIVSRLTAAWIFLSMAEPQLARGEVENGLAVAARLGARRFEPFLTESLARVEMAEGDRDRAAATAERALEDVRALGAMSFIGPWVLATVGRTTSDPRRRAEALAEGEALLAKGCVGHNYFRFRRYAAEACLDAGDPAEARRHACALRDYTANEPTPWSDFYVARAMALADAAEGGDVRANLAALRETAAAVSLRAAIPGIDAAIAALGGDAGSGSPAGGRPAQTATQKGRRSP
jgi:class 3 adenylate cyclase/tetratricopeptide (TPR) repeat protein